MARLLQTEVGDLAELKWRLDALRCPLREYSVAVEALLFNEEKQWILLERGEDARDEVGKLEGVGGRIEGRLDFRSELQREIAEEVGPEANIKILRFVEVKSDCVRGPSSAGYAPKDWIIVSYLCKHISGRLRVLEPHKNRGFVFVDDLDVDPRRLSSSCRQSLETLKARWPEWRSSLDDA
jgi:ADP-ribose pyrophosphatase YjhB (NUDIX family)